MNKKNDEMFIIKFTKKGEKLNEEIKKGFNYWLKESDLTEDELLKYKNVKGFHIQDEEDGSFLAYYENGKEKQIGIGLYKEQRSEMEWIFGYACALLDKGNNYKSDFAKEFIKWGTKNEKR